MRYETAAICRRVHLWDQTKALPPSGQGTPECSPCKSSLVPSNQSSPARHASGHLDHVPMACCLADHDKATWELTPKTVKDCISPSQACKHHIYEPALQCVHAGGSGHHRTAVPKPLLQSDGFHGDCNTSLPVHAAEASSPAHMAPDLGCPQDAPKLLTPNRKTLVRGS